MIEENSSDIENELAKLGYWNNIYSINDYFGTGPTILAKLAHNILQKHAFKSILELGCGQGRDCLFFAELNYDVVAIDISQNAIDFVKSLKNEKNLKNLELHTSDISEPMKFLNKKFELVYSNLALQFFNLSQLENIFLTVSNLMNSNSLFLFSTKKEGDKYFNFGNKINDNSFEYKGITRFFFKENEIKQSLENFFDIISFDDDEHVNTDDTKSVWWKILVKKKL
jgi:SAM-dependent methyltransferase